MEKELKCSTTTCDKILDQDYWNTQWEAKATGWDIGYSSPAIEDYIHTLDDKSIAILIPGCGNAYEAEFLLKNGFSNITLIDIAPKAVETLQEKFKNDPQIKVICNDFFLHEGKYDLIIEQTFFCALPPAMRKQYADKTAELLNKGGKIAGLLFNRTFEEGPPFGGSSSEYKTLFESNFAIKKMEVTEKSIPQRKGAELFIEFIKE